MNLATQTRVHVWLCVHTHTHTAHTHTTAQCEAYDVIGRIGYGLDFGATSDLHGPGAQVAENITEAMHLKMLRTRNPLFLIPWVTKARLCVCVPRAAAVCVRARVPQ